MPAIPAQIECLETRVLLAAPNPLQLSSLLPANGGSGTVGFVLNGAAAGDQAAVWPGMQTVAGVGDINGDGLDDFLIGAPYADPNGLADAGTSYLVFGTVEGTQTSLNLSTINGTNGFALHGLAAGDRSGFIASAAGDVNGDGFGDLLIGTYGADPNGSYSGQCYLVFGGLTNLNSLDTAGGSTADGQINLATLNGTTGFVLNGIANPDLAGFSLSGGGDVNGDGFADLLIGAINAGRNEDTDGQVYVVFGGTTNLSTLDVAGGTAADGRINLSALNAATGFVLASSSFRENVGWSVSNAGDVNGDGFADILVGAPNVVVNNTSVGEAYVVFGGQANLNALDAAAGGAIDGKAKLSALNGTTGFVFQGTGAGNLTGWAVSGAGDVNGDGFADVLIGAPSTYTPTSPGLSYLVFGGQTNLAALDTTGGAADGRINLAVLNGTTGFILDGVSAGDRSGLSMSGAGDVNGDGFADLLIGAVQSDANGSDSGQSCVLFGGQANLAALDTTGGGAADGRFTLSAVNGTTGFAINGAAPGDKAGLVSVAGDINGDGFADLLINAYQADPNGLSSGQSYVIFGGNFTNSVTQVGTPNSETLTGSAAVDVLVGGRGNDTLVGNGAADVLYGAVGDDVLAISNTTFAKIDGGNGSDTLRLDGSGLALNLTTLADTKLTNIETIDIRGDGANTLTLSLREVLNITQPSNGAATSNTLTVLRDADDTVNLGAGWIQQADQSIGGVAFNVFKQGAAILNLQLLTQANQSPVFTSTATPSVSENTTTVLTVTATDADLPAQSVTYSITGGADQARFTITTAGVLTFLSAPNYEAPTDTNTDNVYLVAVTANDGAGGTTVQNLSVTVTPVNDISPVFTSTATPNVFENSTAVLTVTATDADLPAQTVTYSITGGADQAKFSITSGGALRFLSAPDYETPTDSNLDNVYLVQVTANDGAGRTTVQSLSVTVTDFDVPTLTVSLTSTKVAENAGTGAVVGTATRSNVANLSQSLTVSLQSSDTSEATVPATVVIPAGAASVTFSVTAVDDNLLDGSQTVQITASAAGFVYSSTGTSGPVGLDTSFGTNGYATVPLNYSLSSVYPDLILQPDGSSISISQTPGTDTSWRLVRRTISGAVDNTFGVSGTVTTVFASSTLVAPTALALQPDGKIIAVGHASGGTLTLDDALVVRYNSNGSLDSTFASGGILRLESTTNNIWVNDIALLSDGSILLAGFGSGGLVTRITAMGVVDTSFGTNGFVSITPSGYAAGYTSFKSLAVQSDGKILAAGTVTTTNFNQTLNFVARFLANGTLDTSYSGDGLQFVDTNPSANSIATLQRTALQSDGKLLLVGFDQPASGGNSDWGMARLNTDGSLDNSFSGDGVTLLDFNGLDDKANDFVLQSDGKIVVMGEAFVSPNGYELAVARLNPDGTLDTTFNGNGKLILPSWPAVFEQIRAGQLNPAGQLVFLAGYTTDMRVGRLNLGALVQSDTLTVTDYETLTIAIGPTSVSENAGPAAVAGTVTRSNTANLSASLTVSLSSSDTTELTVPATVVIPAGQASATFAINAVNDTLLDGTQSVTIQGSASGYFSISDSLSVLDDDANVRPVASPQSVYTNEDSPLRGQVTATDANNDPLQYAVVTNPLHGQVSMDLSGAYVYTPAANFFGTDTFQFVAYDGALLSVAATVTVTVLPVNDAPLAVADSYTVDEDQVLAVTAPLQLANRLQMTSDPGDWVGQGDTYDYGVAQGTFTATTSLSHDSVRINFQGFTGGANYWSIEFASPLSGTPLTPGTYLGAERAAFHSQGKPGLEVSGQGRGSNTLTGYFVIQTISFSANGQLETFSATFEQHSEGSAPALRGTVQYSTLSSSITGVLSNDSDIDSAPLTAVLVTGPAHGTVQLNANGTFTYTPASNYQGPDSFTYRTNDGSLNSAPAVVSLVVNSVPDAPSVQNQSFAVTENSANGTVVGTAVASDGDPGQTLAYAIQSSTLPGAFAINAQTGQITVANGVLLDFEQVTSTTLTVTVTDNDNPALTTTALMTVAINDAPDRDIRMISATANGTTTLTVTYEVVGLTAPAFTLGAYSSADDQFGSDTLLRSVVINAPADLTVGTHVKTWTIGSGTGQIPLLGAGATELNTDYYLLFVADPADAIAEDDLGGINEDNVAVFTGVYHPAAGQVLVHGGVGADTITVVTGSSIAVTVNGTTYTYAVSDAAGVRVRTHGGEDTVDGSSFSKPLAVWSGAGKDNLTGGAAADSLYGGAGNDTMAGLGGNDSLFGGTDDDRYLFAANVQLGTDALNDNDGGIDTLDFSATTTQNVALNLALTSTQTVNANLRITLASWITFENIVGGALDDTLTGNWLSNVLAGGGGNDKYIFDTDGALGSDIIDESGAGTDTIDFSSTTTKGVSFNLGLTTPQIVNANLTLALTAGNAVENVFGGSQNDSLTGNDLANILTGNGGSDTLTGGGGNDTVTGSAGNDSYVFDADFALGSDTLNESGGGVDVLDFSPTTLEAVAVRLDLSTAQEVNGNLTLTLGSATTFENLIGGSQNDSLTGNSLGNVISGGAGNDLLNGSTANDTLVGDAGNDTLVGAAGNDVYQFAADTPLGSDTLDETGGGTDTLDFSTTLAQAVAVNLGIAAAQIVNANLSLTLGSATTIENVIGGALGDTLTGSAINNAITGAGGDDTVSGGAGNDAFLFDADLPLGSDTLVETTGGGTDTLDFSPTNYVGVMVDLSNPAQQTVNGNLALLLGNAGVFESAIGSAQSDVLTGNALANGLSGGLGSDSLTGGAGNDSLTGGDGLDTLTGGDGNDTYNFDADTALGVDWVFETTTGGVDTLSFASTTTQSVTVELMVAWYQVVNSNLTLFLSGPEVIENVVGGTLGDILAGNILANNLAGGAGDDILRGSDGNDVLVGGAGNDVLFGDFGDDVYQFDTDSPLGSDTIDEPGLSGTDLLDFSQTTTLGVSIDLSNVSTQVVNANLMLTLLSADLIANVNGGSLNDNITGNARANVLTGNAGDDTLNGGVLNDTLVGGAGNDTLIGGDYDDTYQFDADATLGADLLVESNWILGGVDLLDFSPTTSIGITIDLSSAAAQVVNSRLTLTLSIPDGFEGVVGTSLADTIRGNALNNFLLGGAGNDTVLGFGGRDVLAGGTGADRLTGGEDDDILIAGTISYYNESTKAFNRAALDAIMAEWMDLDPDYATRISHLRSGGGMNFSTVLNGTTALTDGTAIDTLFGEGGLDWFWKFTGDTSPDLNTGGPETVN